MFADRDPFFRIFFVFSRLSFFFFFRYTEESYAVFPAKRFVKVDGTCERIDAVSKKSDETGQI